MTPALMIERYSNRQNRSLKFMVLAPKQLSSIANSWLTSPLATSPRHSSVHTQLPFANAADHLIFTSHQLFVSGSPQRPSLYAGRHSSGQCFRNPLHGLPAIEIKQRHSEMHPLHLLEERVRSLRIKHLVACHHGHEILRVRQVDDIMCPARNHIHSFDPIARHLELDGLAGHDVSLLNQSVTMRHDLPDHHLMRHRHAAVQ